MSKATNQELAIEYSQKAYLNQQDLEYTAENVEMYGMPGTITYVTTIDNIIVTLHDSYEIDCKFLNAINKETLNMEVIEC